jgi:hypothetical protein
MPGSMLKVVLPRPFAPVMIIKLFIAINKKYEFCKLQSTVDHIIRNALMQLFLSLYYTQGRFRLSGLWQVGLNIFPVYKFSNLVHFSRGDQIHVS